MLSESDYNQDDTIKPHVQKIKVTSIKFKNNCWSKFSLFIDNEIVIDKIKLMPYGIYDSSFIARDYKFNFCQELPWRAVKFKIELFQMNNAMKSENISNLFVEYSDKINLNDESAETIIGLVNRRTEAKEKEKENLSSNELDPSTSYDMSESEFSEYLVYKDDDFDRRWVLDPNGAYDVGSLYI